MNRRSVSSDIDDDDTIGSAAIAAVSSTPTTATKRFSNRRGLASSSLRSSSYRGTTATMSSAAVAAAKRQRALVLFLIGLAALFALLVLHLAGIGNHALPTNSAGTASSMSTVSTTDGSKTGPHSSSNERKRCDNPRYYEHWRELAVRLASMPPNRTLDELERHDPFWVRKFETRLTAEEERLGRTLQLDELRQLFPCENEGGVDTDRKLSSCDRISLPDQRDHDKDAAFRNNADGTFLFFQHLRKAGGTHFCSLAESNLPKNALPSYYCMPDYHWEGGTYRRCAGCLHHWTNEEISQRMRAQNHRIAGNEWDNFDPSRHFDLDGAIFATSFRRPLDRALSQFRFECIEERGCKIKNVTEWWIKRKDLYNVFTVTFADPPKMYNKLELAYLDDGGNPQHATTRGELVGTALDTVAKFHLVLVMEWLAYAGKAVQDVLGFRKTAQLTKRVRPHLGQAERNDGQDSVHLGAASVKKASWDPKEYLNPQQYEKMSQLLALDAVLTDAARRMFLERLLCNERSS